MAYEDTGPDRFRCVELDKLYRKTKPITQYENHGDWYGGDSQIDIPADIAHAAIMLEGEPSKLIVSKSTMRVLTTMMDFKADLPVILTISNVMKKNFIEIDESIPDDRAILKSAVGDSVVIEIR